MSRKIVGICTQFELDGEKYIFKLDLEIESLFAAFEMIKKQIAIGNFYPEEGYKIGNRIQNDFFTARRELRDGI